MVDSKKHTVAWLGAMALELDRLTTVYHSLFLFLVWSNSFWVPHSKFRATLSL